MKFFGAPTTFAGFALASILSCGVSLAAPIIAAVGLDTTTRANWRTTTTVKPLDLNADNVYGTQGYAAFFTTPGGATLSSLPLWLTLSTNGVTTHFSSNLYPAIDNPALTPGPSVADIETGVSYRQGVTTGNLYNLTFGSGTPAGPIRIGIFENSAMSSQASYTLTSGANSATQTFGAIENDGIVRYAFFDITNAVAGNVVTISGTIAPAGSTVNDGLSGITIDVPEPIGVGMLVLAIGALVSRHRSK